MSESENTKRVSDSASAFGPEQVQARLDRLGSIPRPGDARRGRVKLMLDILHAIASGTVEDPARTAATFVVGVDESLILRQGLAVEPRKRRFIHAQALIGDQLFVEAEKIGRKMPLDETTLDFLYKHSRLKRLPRKEWEQGVRTACSLDRIVRHVRGYLPDSLIGRDAEIEAFEKLKSGPGMLLLSFHGAYVLVARRLFAKNVAGGQIFGRGGSITTKDVRGALFTALRSIQDGSALLMSSDGPDGKITGTLDVLGAAAPAGEGAAYLAYATNCRTGWYTVLRRGDKFVPIIEPGPSRNKGESFKEFKERFQRFSAEKIEENFTGDPHNIVLRPGWSRVFHAKARGLPIPNIFARRGEETSP